MADDLTRAHDPIPNHSTVALPPGAVADGAGTRVDDFEIGDEIARGGMGAVHRGRDVALNREVAIKVLLAPAAHGVAARRFLEEAQITGQLQHPGIPPIHRAGTLADGRPYLAMKLIKGRTLAQWLEGNDPPSAGERLAVFEGIAQAVGYAHEHRVIHRDLKPTNVMVGTFGEVQVMDWGLAKQIRSAEFGMRSEEGPLVFTPHSELRTPNSDETQAGSVLGTLAFMPPEQAAGAVELVDARSDVFGLGAILCVLLAGRPPYVGTTAESTRLLAARAKLDDAFLALDGCGADPELVALCKRCLAADMADRPADGGAVAHAVAAIRTAAGERARRAEIATAEAVVQSSADRKRRRTWLRALAAVAVVLLAGTAASAWMAVRAHWAEQATAEQLALTSAAEGKAREAAAVAQDAERKAADREAKERAARLDADKQRRQAKDEAASALAVKDFVCDILATTDVKKNATPAEVAAANREAKKKLDYAVRRLADFDGKPAAEAEIRNTIGMMYDTLKAVPEAEAQLKRSLELYEEAFSPTHDLTLHAARTLGGFYVSLERWADAEPLFRRVLTGFEKDSGLNAIFGLKAAQQLAAIAEQQKRPADAIVYFRRGLPLAQRGSTGPDSAAVLSLRHSLANALMQNKELAEAEREFRAVIAAAVARGTADDWYVSSASWGLEECLAWQGKHEAAGQEIRDHLARITAAVGPDHERTREHTVRLGVYHSNRRQFDRSIPIFEGVVKQTGDTAAACRPLLHLGTDLLAVGRPADGLAALERGERVRRTHNLTDAREHAYHALAEAYRKADRDESLRALNRAHAAEVMAVAKPGTVARADGLAYVGWYMLTVRQFAEAEPVLRESLATWEQVDPDGWPTHNAAWMLGWAMVGRGKVAAAEPLLLRGYAGLKRKIDTIPEMFREVVVAAADRLVAVSERLDRPADAAKWRAERATYPREAAPVPHPARP